MKELAAMLGFAVRAGQIALGGEKCVALIRSGNAAVALLDREASENTKKRVTDACAYRQVPLIVLDKDELGRATGRDGCVAAAMPKGGMARRVAEITARTDRATQHE